MKRAPNQEITTTHVQHSRSSRALAQGAAVLFLITIEESSVSRAASAFG